MVYLDLLRQAVQLYPLSLIGYWKPWKPGTDGTFSDIFIWPWRA